MVIQPHLCRITEKAVHMALRTGLTSASSTLAGQAYGAGNYHEVGLVLQRSIGIIALV
jgi:Na+-driven multidrug efflux pump